MRDLKWGVEEWAVDCRAAWSKKLAVLESLGDVEWPGCEVSVELRRNEKMRGEVRSRYTYSGQSDLRLELLELAVGMDRWLGQSQ